MESTIMLGELLERFPWLESDSDAGSGADVISALCDWYVELKAEIEKRR